MRVGREIEKEQTADARQKGKLKNNHTQLEKHDPKPRHGRHHNEQGDNETMLFGKKQAFIRVDSGTAPEYFQHPVQHIDAPDSHKQELIQPGGGNYHQMGLADGKSPGNGGRRDFQSHQGKPRPPGGPLQHLLHFSVISSPQPFLPQAPEPSSTNFLIFTRGCLTCNETYLYLRSPCVGNAIHHHEERYSPPV